MRRLWQKVFRFAALYARGATGQEAQKEENTESKLRRIEEYHQAIRAVRGEGATVKRSHRTPSARVDSVVEQLPLEFDVETAPDSELAVLFGEAAAAEGWDDDSADTLDAHLTANIEIVDSDDEDAPAKVANDVPQQGAGLQRSDSVRTAQ